MLGVNPSPANTTSPRIGQAAMSWIVDGIFSSAVPFSRWNLHSMPSVRLVSTCVSTTSILRIAPQIRRATRTCVRTCRPSPDASAATSRTRSSPVFTAAARPGMVSE